MVARLLSGDFLCDGLQLVNPYRYIIQYFGRECFFDVDTFFRIARFGMLKLMIQPVVFLDYRFPVGWQMAAEGRNGEFGRYVEVE